MGGNILELCRAYTQLQNLTSTCLAPPRPRSALGPNNADADHSRSDEEDGGRRFEKSVYDGTLHLTERT